MFFRKDKKADKVNDNDILSPVTGQIFPTNQINDSVFSQEMLGQTVSIHPLNEKLTLVAPTSGMVEVLYPTGHAFAIRMNNGIGILVHIGIDTVELKGKGFKMLSKQGNRVTAGDPMVKVDFREINNAGFDTSVMMIITENPNTKILKFKENQNINVAERILL